MSTNIKIAVTFSKKVQSAFDSGHTIRLRQKIGHGLDEFLYYCKESTPEFEVYLTDDNELYLMDNFFGCVTDTDQKTLLKRFAKVSILSVEPIELQFQQH